MPTQLVSIQSEPAPEPGQKNRSSANFQFTILPPGVLKITVAEHPSPDLLRFNIMRDRRLGRDPVVLQGVRNGVEVSASEFETDTSYYIADPVGTAGRNFLVEIDALA